MLIYMCHVVLQVLGVPRYSGQYTMAEFRRRMQSFIHHPNLWFRIIVYDSMSQGSVPLDRVQFAIDSGAVIFYIHGDHMCQWILDTLRSLAVQQRQDPDIIFVIFSDDTYYRLRRLLSRNYVKMVQADSDDDNVARQWYRDYEPRLIGHCSCGVYHDGNSDMEGGRAGGSRFA